MLQRQWDHEQGGGQAERFDLIAPPSHCLQCGTRLSIVELIPVLSWLAQRGRCRHCSTPIGLRTLCVEAGLGLMFGLAVWHFGPSLEAVAAWVLLSVLLALAVIDLETRILPDRLTLPLLWIGLIFNLSGLFASLEAAVAGAIAGYLSLWSINTIYRLIAGREGMGYGDFKLFAALGAWFGWSMLPVILIAASSAGALFGLAALGLNRQRADQAIAFGPWLALAALPALFGLLPSGIIP
jgi:leader peptidase (prepilin peptidase)/N-methyltransferase